jgi:hypothetical protein
MALRILMEDKIIILGFQSFLREQNDKNMAAMLVYLTKLTRNLLLITYTNMAAMTSLANEEYKVPLPGGSTTYCITYEDHLKKIVLTFHRCSYLVFPFVFRQEETSASLYHLSWDMGILLKCLAYIIKLLKILKKILLKTL